VIEDGLRVRAELAAGGGIDVEDSSLDDEDEAFGVPGDSHGDSFNGQPRAYMTILFL
jgi:hypothetical protein